MASSTLLDGLSPEQRAIVTAEDIPLLVLAGAGSGKTRVLTHRIAWLINQGRTYPGGVLAVTFTNKATREMLERITTLAGSETRSMWIGTFHAIAHRLLRRHASLLGLPPTFTILDEEDQKRLIQSLIHNLGFDLGPLTPGAVQTYINRHKDEGRRSHQLGTDEPPTLLTLYQEYEKRLAALGAVDFADLLLRALELWERHPDVLKDYRRRFRYVFVDEFQDSNTVQYRWLLRLVHEGPIPFAVGDDDQAIYGWRGAHPEHLQSFLADVSGARLVRLERNYRSHQGILDVANALISCNHSRLGKKLWSEDRTGPPIHLHLADDEEDEARWIADWLEIRRREAPKSAAILYRINAQSRPLEDALLRRGIPYRLVGAVRFFQRAEVKDALSYLRLVRHDADDLAFLRIVNRPSRGIGERTIAALERRAEAEGSLARAARAIVADSSEAVRTRRALEAFLGLLEQLRHSLDQLPLPEFVAHVIDASGLKRSEDEREEGHDDTRLEERRANLDELVAASAHFMAHAEEDGISLPETTGEQLDAFLAYCQLQADDRDSESRAGSEVVWLMSLHAAKGLEFERVVLVGLNDGLLPHARALDDPRALEEERRLLYVGITRARRELVLTARRRRIQRSEGRLHALPAQPSRFLGEIPSALLVKTGLNDSEEGSPISTVDTTTGYPWKPGDGVLHPVFGEGVVTACTADAGGFRIEVRFRRGGTKWLLAEYARLTRLTSR